MPFVNDPKPLIFYLKLNKINKKTAACLWAGIFRLIILFLERQFLTSFPHPELPYFKKSVFLFLSMSL
ncbi:hypothetical protein A3H66_02560 [Candidatus Falkowbacteria bacterium RIFCSPLOWO2_02_FULL_45_21]|uniref:Uncharacterized protein n=1 Tax=Candidatus Falkowbacteria bacterium RIFCSPLOWO2_02_FULL_45_21 TaxID=1797989 RepID=A0A1F5SC17_9BACT|nr:MAG: hypothetical protein A3H66_02560 [Candidatus Falkowbacteria bacterium RIFCSPLOWO2_02_FULL_45_21]